jgi:hypothetical protein
MGEVDGPSTNTNAPVVSRVSRRNSAVWAETPEDHVGSRHPVVGVASGVPGHQPLATLAQGAAAPSFGPLMNPSSETASPVRTLPIVVVLSWDGLGGLGSGGRVRFRSSPAEPSTSGDTAP